MQTFSGYPSSLMIIGLGDSAEMAGIERVVAWSLGHLLHLHACSHDAGCTAYGASAGK